MARSLTTVQFNTLQADATYPVFLIQLEHAGYLEYLSTSLDCAFNGDWYAAGGVEIDDVQEGVSASLSLFATTDRIRESLSGGWRKGKICRIYHIPAPPETEGDFVITDAIMVFDGFIDTSSYRGERVRVTAVPKTTVSLYSPRSNFSEISDIIPSPGTTFTWEGVSYILQAKK